MLKWSDSIGIYVLNLPYLGEFMPTSIGLGDFLSSVYVPSRLELGHDSIYQMEITIRLFERWAGHALSLRDLGEDYVRRFLADYRQSHSAATTNSKRCHLLAIWRCAWEEEILAAPPRAKRIRKAKSTAAIPEAWSPEEVAKILAVAEGTTGETGGVPTALWWRSFLLVAYDTGERKGAMLRVQPCDLSLEGGWIVFQRIKTGGPRYCPLSDEAVCACRLIYDTSRRLLWPWPYSREALDKRFRAILRRSGVAFGRRRGGLFHKLRRTSGTLVEANGGDGAKHIGDTRAVFERHYRDPRFFGHGSLDRLPRPQFSGPRLRVV
jgi:integrase